MSNFTDFFPAAGGGGGGIAKYQEFTSSGTFTPTQALIDAGGRLCFIMVAGGGKSDNESVNSGGGGTVIMGYQTLTSTTACTTTIGTGATSTDSDGGDTSISFSSAGGTDETAPGGLSYYGATPGPNWGGRGSSGGTNNGGGSNGWDAQAKNYGAGARSSVNAGSGFVRITWFE